MDLSDSNSDEPRPSSSPLTRMRDDDVEAMLRKRKQLRTTTATLLPSPVSKMSWTKNDELVLLGGIVDYENETELSYRSDWDAFYRYIKDSIEANFSKKQLIDKVKNLKRRFTYNQARFNDEKGFSFTNTDDDEIFKLSMIIWAKNETECVSNENLDQAKVCADQENKDVPCAEQDNKDVPCVDQENEDVPCVDQENKDVPCAEQDNKDVPCVHQENKDVPCVDQENKDVPCVDQENEDVPCVAQENKDVPCVEQENKDVPCVDQENEDVSFAEQERVSIEIDNGEKEKSEEDGVDELCGMEETLDSGTTFFQSLGKNGEEDGVDELCVLQEALEAQTLFQNLSKYQQKFLLQNLENIGAQRKKELIDEWKALLIEEIQFNIKKQTLSAKLAKGGVSP